MLMDRGVRRMPASPMMRLMAGSMATDLTLVARFASRARINRGGKA